MIRRFFEDKDGRIVIFEQPNLPLLVGLIATVLSWVLPYGQLNFIAALISFGALFTWAWLELTDGRSWYRRALGCAVLIWLVLSKIA